MYISCNLLKSFLKPCIDINWLEVWDKFTIITAEVESIEHKGENISNIIIGKIVSVTPHKLSNSFKVAKVDIGGITLQSVSALRNLSDNTFVPIAIEGSSTVTNSNVKKEIIDDEISECIICSERDLGISDDHSKPLKLNGTFKTGDDFKKMVPIEDIIVEIDNKSLTNRPDLWGHYGIAREIAAMTGSELINLSSEFDSPTNNSSLPNLDVSIEDVNNCNRYSCVSISNIKQKETPLNIKILLNYCGMRSNSLIVDLSNYIMLELGQPMHAYDSNSVDKIIVKNTKNNVNTFKTLDNIEREVPINTIIIKNSSSILGIAGVIGGYTSAVTNDTTDIIVESANFNASSVRITASKLGLRTDASSRFEKNLDPNLTIIALKRFTQLLTNIDNKSRISSELFDSYINEINPKMIILKKDQLAKYMGERINDSLVENILTSLSFIVTTNENYFKVNVPTFRATKDVSTSVDLIEEIARSYGYNNLIPEPLESQLVLPKEMYTFNEFEYSFKHVLASKFNLNEIHTYLWYDSKFLKHLGIAKDNVSLKVANTSKNENNYLRQELALSLLHCIYKNANKHKKIGIFEIGSVLKNDKICSNYNEKKRIGIALFDEVVNTQAMYFRMKSIVFTSIKMLTNSEIELEKSKRKAEVWEQNGAVLDVKYDNKVIGYISLVNNYITSKVANKSACVIAEIDMSEIMNLKVYENEYNEPSKFPTVVLDFNFAVSKNINYKTVKDYIDSYSNELVKGYKLIDYYEGENIEEHKRSLTFRFTIGSYDKTLTNEDISKFSNTLIDYMANNNIYIRV